MLTDPQSVTISGTANSLPRVSTTVNSSTYQKDDGTVKLSVSHAYGKRNRRSIRLEHSKIAADPLISAQSIKYTMYSYIVLDTPVTGYTVPEAKAVVDGFIAALSASTGALITQVLGGQN